MYRNKDINCEAKVKLRQEIELGLMASVAAKPRAQRLA